MWASSEVCLRHVAVCAEDLQFEIVWIAPEPEPPIESPTSGSSQFPPMLCTITVDMVENEEFELSLPTARAFPTIVSDALNTLLPRNSSVVLCSSPPRFLLLLEAIDAYVPLVGGELRIPIRLVELNVAFPAQVRWR